MRSTPGSSARVGRRGDAERARSTDRASSDGPSRPAKPPPRPATASPTATRGRSWPTISGTELGETATHRVQFVLEATDGVAQRRRHRLLSPPTRVGTLAQVRDDELHSSGTMTQAMGLQPDTDGLRERGSGHARQSSEILGTAHRCDARLRLRSSPQRGCAQRRSTAPSTTTGDRVAADLVRIARSPHADLGQPDASTAARRSPRGTVIRPPRLGTECEPGDRIDVGRTQFAYIRPAMHRRRRSSFPGISGSL